MLCPSSILFFDFFLHIVDVCAACTALGRRVKETSHCIALALGLREVLGQLFFFLSP